MTENVEKNVFELREFAYSPDHYYQMIMYFSGVRYFRYAFVNIVIMAAMLLAVALWQTGFDAEVLAVALVVIVLVGVICFLVQMIQHYIARNYAYSKENAAMFQKQSITFSPDGYRIVSEDGSEGHGPLSHIVRVQVFNDHYLLFLSKLACLPIPFSAFDSDDDRRRFEAEYLADKMVKPKDRRPLVTLFLLACIVLGFLISHLLLPADPETPEAEMPDGVKYEQPVE